ncbi:MAG: pyridoxine 5'-phosphate synthase [Bacteroides sp.]
MTRLSVNVNKIATVRNARGGNVPNLLEAADIILDSLADGITVHPRPDGRHITYKDVEELSEKIKRSQMPYDDGYCKEFNIEGNPTAEFLDLVRSVQPDQVTLVPDAPEALTSNAGWDTVKYADFLRDVVASLQLCDIRVSIFVDPIVTMVEGAKEVGADRIELYTEAYAAGYKEDAERAIRPYIFAAERARELGLGVNAGHDLNLENLEYFLRRLPYVSEVSIGQALISDAMLRWGLKETIWRYKGKVCADRKGVTIVKDWEGKNCVALRPQKD